MNSEQVIYLMMIVASVSVILSSLVFYRMGRQDGEKLGRWVEEPYQHLQEDYLYAVNTNGAIKRSDFKIGYMLAAIRFARVPRPGLLTKTLADEMRHSS